MSSNEPTSVVCTDEHIWYQSVYMAELVTGIASNDILACARGETDTAGDLHWAFPQNSNYPIQS